MYSKFFTRLFLLIGMIGMFSVPLRAEEVTIGSGTDQQPWLPSHSNYKCSYTQQIYTADEIDHPEGGIINSIAFYNKGTAKTRTWDVYLVNTNKSSFTGANNDWVDVSQGTLVFSGSISLTANQWTPITFTTPFDYTGSNLAVVVNDKTGSYSSGQSCLVFTPSGDHRNDANAGGGFSLQPGKGYLYANSENVTLTFTGAPYNENGQVDLAYDANATLKGWNLIGNPYSTIATLDKAYYRLNQDGNALSATTENDAVEVMEGVFVQATETGQTANFAAITTTNGNTDKVAKLNINVTQSRGTSAGSATTSTGSSTTLDNAIIRFDNGSMLGKFQLNLNKTKVYIPQGDKEYAIVRSAAQGEIPVNFKAEENGSYTLNVSAENMGIHYLHLIDNMTGADVDLLADPSYSFESKTTDYASRFRLLFDANENGDSTSSAIFAYYNGNNWVISNPSTDSGSEATLQVIDIMGRILKSETLNGNAEISLDQPAGIYMLRLVNNNDVKVQKVVVR